MQIPGSYGLLILSGVQPNLYYVCLCYGMRVFRVYKYLLWEGSCTWSIFLGRDCSSGHTSVSYPGYRITLVIVHVHSMHSIAMNIKSNIWTSLNLIIFVSLIIHTCLLVGIIISVWWQFQVMSLTVLQTLSWLNWPVLHVCVCVRMLVTTNILYTY